MEREKNNFYQRIDKFFSRFPQIEGFDYATSQTGSKIIVNRVAPSIKSILTSRAFAKTNKTVFYICKDDKIAEEVAEDTAVLNAEKSVFFIPDFETLPFEERSPHYMIRASRLSALTNLLISQNAIYTLSAKTLLRNIINPQYLTRSVLRIKIGAEYEMTELVKTLNNIGFEHNSQIEKVGQFSKRGGIIDIFSPNYPKPLRFDFFGDEVTSIKPFSVENQRSEKKNITEAVIIPCREVILNEEAMHSSLAGLITLKGFYEGIEQDIPLLYEGKHCLLDYIQPDKSLLILDNLPLFSHEKTSVLGLLHTYQSEINDLYKRITETDRQKSIPAPDRLILNENELQAYFKAFTVAYLNTGDVYTVDRSDNSPPILEGWTRSGRGGYTGSEGLPCHSERSEEPIPLTQTPTYTYDTEKSPDFHGDIEALIERIINLRQMYYTVFIQLENEGQHKRMQQLLADYLADVKFSIGVLHSGFISHDIKLAVFTDHEIFNRVKHRKMDLAFSKGEPIIDYDSLKPGDYIVHIDHGIGVYEGLRTLELSGKSMDCLCIQYAGSDKLYVPTWQLKLVSKYVSEEGATPIVHKIGTKTWDLTKQRAKKSIELVVDEIMNLYAERKLRKGISFKTDSEWQTEMEESFIYDDTPDQTTATAEIKKDMESSTPMERLLCGDVGFGKTEVAVRVAFKAVLSGYQVAVVVPTTLLAEQHYNVFRERLAQFPIRLAMLSRFRTNAEIKNDLVKIKEGKVDIVIGTHRILSKDVEFHRIGLLIIDEEHRFGVRHKDRIRQIKSNIDTLYMSATPIPRTMNMVISKLKSMSLIQTSPKARLPIRTVIVPFDTEVIKDAIMREYDRGGQVFFVHNRVETIQTIYHQLHTLLPNLRMAVAHGQLPEKQLEKIMTEFSEHKYDVLIATTIIESGIDIPNANTILVNRSDMFGMAQLYQIRGRVGRSNKRAYAYLMIPNNLTDDARKRLETLTEYESLGAGYQIAMRDLEIRGAGTLLGTKQSGTIASIGFNFYNRLLDQAVNNIMSANPEGMWHSEEEADELLKIELGTDFFFPPEYITNEKQKLQIYRRMIDFTAGEQFDDLVEELTDRYGALPETAKNVIDYFRLRMTAKNIGLKTFMILSQKMFLEYDVKSLPDRDTLPAIIAFSEVPVSFNATSGLKITFEFSPEMAADKRGKIDFALKLIDFLVGLGKSQSVGNDA